MKPVHPARRRAAAFDAAIEAPSTAGLDARTAELVDLVGAMRQVAPPVARPDFVADLRERLLLAAQTDLVAVPREQTARTAPVQRPTSRRDRRIAVAIGGFAIVGATTSMAVAAQSALPGDVLYPVKRALEDADTGLSAQEDKGPELLQHATSRLVELDELSRRTDDVDAMTQRAIESTLTTFSDQAGEASDILLEQFSDTGEEQGVAALRTFTGESISRLVALEAELPTDVRPAVIDAAQVLFVIDQAASEACPGCDGLGITSIPPTLTAATSLPDRAVETVEAVVEGTGREPAATQSPAEPGTPRSGTDDVPSTPTVPVPEAPQAPATEDPVVPAVPAPTKAPTVPRGTGGVRTTNPGGTLLDDLGRLLDPQRGSTPAPTGSPVPALGDVVEGTVEGLNGITEGLVDPLRPKQP